MNAKGILVAMLGFGFLVAQAKPQKWRMTFRLSTPILEDDTGDAEDTIRNGVSSIVGKSGGFVRDYAVSDDRRVLTVLVEYKDTPKVNVGGSFLLGKTTATILSAVKL